MIVFEKMCGNRTDKYGRHHWTWFATNGKSDEENFMIQREEIRKWRNAIIDEQRLARENNLEDDIFDVKINIKTEVKK